MTKVLQKAGFVGETIYVGIDVHLKSWNVSLYYGSQYLRSFHQSPHPDILVSFLQREFPGANYSCAYEAGFSGYWIKRAFDRQGVSCIVVNPADIPQTDKGNKSKTDRDDSKRIGSSLQAGMLCPIYIPSQETEADRQLVRTNEKLTRDLTRSKNRIKGMLYQVGIEIPERFGSGNWSNIFINWLKDLPISFGTLRTALNHQIKMMENIRVEKNLVLKDIRKLAVSEKYAPIASRLKTVPGVGTITAITLITEIEDMNRFKSFEKLNAFVGFYPSEFSSGEHIRTGHIISRHHKRLRSLILEAAWIGIRRDPAMTQYYNNTKLKVGGKRAIIKVSRKLLNRIRSIWLNKIDYEIGILK